MVNPTHPPHIAIKSNPLVACHTATAYTDLDLLQRPMTRT